MLFRSILSEYQKKVAALSRTKRKLQKAEDERIAIEKWKQEAIKEIQKLANDATPLPWNLPDKETMQEMIDDEICKVCGRREGESLQGDYSRNLCEPCGLCKTYCIRTLSEIQARNVAHGQIIGLV